jgi:hypothetical protein
MSGGLSWLACKFRVEARPSATNGALAVHLTDIAMWFALKALDEWIRGGLGKALAAIEADMRGASQKMRTNCGNGSV